MEEQYKLEKWEWTEDDFERMGWHDCPIYAFRFEDNIYFDIDYIFKWNDNGGTNFFTFWIAPVTLVFEQPYYFKVNIESDFINGLEIAQVSMSRNAIGKTIWNIVTQQGEVIIGAEKFKQIIRRPPSLQFGQAIPFDERGDISFSQISEKDYQPDSEIIKKKGNELRLFKMVKDKWALILKKDTLDRDILGTKKYLTEKRDAEKRILEIDAELFDTIFKNW